MVVDHRLYAAPVEQESGVAECLLVVERIDPDIDKVGTSETHHLEAHERDLLNERKVPSDEFGDLYDGGRCLLMDDDADLDTLLELSESQDAPDGFVEGTGRLHHVVVQ